MRDFHLQVPGPGQLFKALSVFALRGVDMTKIESRPVREGSSRQFDYLFYVDLVGGMGEHVIQNALRQLQVRLWPTFHVCGEFLRSSFQASPGHHSRYALLCLAVLAWYHLISRNKASGP